jgi:eukaryotic-like serine/threonine-protein kinase
VYGPPMHPLADTGRVIAGRYRLAAPIGRGAMGVVWRARDQLLDRDVAVKEVQIADTLSADERANAYQRTLREAKTAARLSHPGVVSVYDVADDGGRPWIVMELVNAQSLDQMLAASGPLSPRQTAEMGRQLLAALTVAHNAGVLHRDVKPSNVLLGADGRAVLTDFGIATFQGDPKLTQTGMVMGSPGFTAPERIRGGGATPASDLWSLGATLYAAVQGHGPYESRGGAITTMSAIINEDAPAAPTAGALAPIIEALLRREPADRPDAATATRMISDVLHLLPDRAGAPGSSYEPTSVSATPPPAPAPLPAPAAAGGAGAGGAEAAVGGGAGSAAGGAWGVPAETSLDALGPAPTGLDPAAAAGAAVAPGTLGMPALPDLRGDFGGSGDAGASDGPGVFGGFGASGGVGASGGLGASGAPDFSSWYSSPRPADRPTGGPDVAAWPGAQTGGTGAPSWAPADPGQQGQSGLGQPGPGPSGMGQSGTGQSGTGQSGTGRPGRQRQRSAGVRWLLILAALAVIGAGAGAATIMALRHNNNAADTGPSGPTASASSAPGGNTTGTTSPTRSLPLADAINSPLGANSPPPPGYSAYTQPAPQTANTDAGFSVSVPSSWSAAHSGYQTYLRNPTINEFLLVDLTPHTYPANMLREVRYIKSNSASAHPGYLQLGLGRTDIRGWPGAYWKFSFDLNGVRQEVLDLLWVADTSAGTQSYAMYFSAPASYWNTANPVFTEQARSFTILPG